MSFEVLNSKLSGLCLIKPALHTDARGWFFESYKESEFQKIGLPTQFKQDNHVRSTEKGILRGLHYQMPPHAQGKLVRCIQGKVLDVAVDIRKNSKTVGQWDSFELSEENHHMVWIPEGFAHGYLTLTQNSEVLYKVTSEYHPQSERTILWNDPEIGVQWGIQNPILNEKDLSGVLLKNRMD